MEICLIICSTIVICFFGYLYYKANEIYVDSEVQSGNIISHNGKNAGYFVRYKRVYKNGKTIYFEVNYTS